VLSAVAPNGTDTIEAFEAAGGARALLTQLEPLLDLNAMTVTGQSIGENLAGADVFDEEVIRPLERPFSNKPPIVVLHGSLAPESAGRRSSPARRSCMKTDPTRSRPFSAAT